MISPFFNFGTKRGAFRVADAKYAGHRAQRRTGSGCETGRGSHSSIRFPVFSMQSQGIAAPVAVKRIAFA